MKKKDTYPRLEQRPIQSLKPHPDGVRSPPPQRDSAARQSNQRGGRPLGVSTDPAGASRSGGRGDRRDLHKLLPL